MNLQGIELEEESLKTNGVRLHTVLAGPQRGQPVVLLHGFPEFWLGWQKQIPTLASAGYRVIAPDQRGYNLSDKPRGIRPYRAQELARDILGLMDSLGYEKVYLAGHDWGGIVAWLVAAWYPQRLKKLAILNAPHPAAMLKALTRDPAQIARSWYALMFQLPWLPEAGMRAQDWRGGVRALRGSGKIHTFTNQDIEAYKRAWSQPGAMMSMINWYRAAFWHRPGGLGRISVPALILWGMQDVALGPKLAEASMKYCEAVHLEYFPSATHWVQHDAAEEVSSQLLEWFES